jgi:hypothetical protein
MLPGFTADAALYPRSQQYEMVGGFEAPTAGATVVPQACVRLGPCQVCVDVRVFPPRACVRFSCLGFNRSFCVP